MIVLRRPFIVYDLDLVGAGVCAALLGAIWAIVQPVLGDADAQSRSQSALAAVQAEQRAVVDALPGLQARSREIEAALAQELSSIATVSDLPAALASIARHAASRGLELKALAPQLGASEPGLRSFEIQIAAEGPALECVGLLSDLIADYPWTTVREFAIQSGDAGGCTLVCKVRWLARSPETSGAGGGA